MHLEISDDKSQISNQTAGNLTPGSRFQISNYRSQTSPLISDLEDLSPRAWRIHQSHRDGTVPTCSPEPNVYNVADLVPVQHLEQIIGVSDFVVVNASDDVA